MSREMLCKMEKAVKQSWLCAAASSLENFLSDDALLQNPTLQELTATVSQGTLNF